jgi:uncharacterized linocin/CFP29 family protein
MGSDNYQLTWTDQQWGRIRQVVQDEANRARVAATFLPLTGPLPADTDFVPSDELTYPASGERGERMQINDTSTIPLATLQVKVFLRGAQVADPDLTSALQMFRRAANVLARLEDIVVFNGQAGPSQGPKDKTPGLPTIWEILGGRQGATPGLATSEPGTQEPERVSGDPENWGELLVSRVSSAIGKLEGAGHFGPFAVVLGQRLFNAVQTPNETSLVLPQDRIIPFLGGGPLLRSSALPDEAGVVVGLGGQPIDLVVATDVSVNFLQVTTDPMFVFRVYEKIALRIKEKRAIVRLLGPAEHDSVAKKK